MRRSWRVVPARLEQQSVSKIPELDRAEYASLFRPWPQAVFASRHRPRLTIEQSSHVLFRESRANAPVAIEQAISQSSLSRLEFIHFLLDRTGRHQAVDKNRLVLSDAMSTINRLLVDRRIQPGIEHDN